MPFETPNLNLVGDITATVHEHGGVAPTTVIQLGTSWAVNINWELKGQNWQMIGGHWHLHVNLESMGPGPEISLADVVDAACQNQALPSPTGEYFCHFDVAGNRIENEWNISNPGQPFPHQSLPMKLVVTLTYHNPLGQPGPMAAYYEGPILQFYRAN